MRDKKMARTKFIDRYVLKILKIQVQCASFLQRKTQGLSWPAKKGLLVAFCVIASGCSILIITKALTSKNGKDLRIIMLKLPKYIGKAGVQNTSSYVVISEGEYRKIKRFKKYMDSLAGSKVGRQKHDSILKSRPLLLDSIRCFENMYPTPSFKK